jgi:hypothetical protein
MTILLLMVHREQAQFLLLFSTFTLNKFLMRSVGRVI